jgi:hypothetical protein
VKNRIPLAVVSLLIPLGALAACGSSQGSSASGRQLASQAATAASQPATVAGAVRRPVRAAPATSRACGAQGAETLARTAGLVATRIYAFELASSEVSKDKRQVESYVPLLSALEGGNHAAINQAVTSLVYSHTHVVRLRVTRGNQVLADVGGPHIIAPVGGTLQRNGRTLGHYVLSVQDDLGYVKLVTRFLGVPLVLSSGSHALNIEGAVSPSPAAIPTHGAVSYRGKSYQAFSFPAQAFPSGGLRVSILVPVPWSLSRQSCSAIKVAELGHVAELVSHRFSLGPSNFGSYIKAAAPLTGGLIYIRAGSHQLAGSSQPGPANLPSQGTVSYRGSSYGVSSFTAASEAGQVRIYQLIRQ